ncbi:MAG: sugar phosphate isomerase/epimerase [Acidimicrobiales bacterium]|nr:sugar phosphate isomerase/epimerase [Acidimicrobiales bacterium]
MGLSELVERIASMGYDGVELTPDWLTDDRLDELSTALSAAGLAVSGALIGADGSAFEQRTVDRLHSLDVDTVTVLAMGSEHFADRSSVERTADHLDRLAALAAGHGLRLGYHNHTWEVATSIEGRPALELLFDRVDPAVVAEVDVYWVACADSDPAELVERLADRVRLLHLKDGPCCGFDDDMVAVGDGDLDVAAVLRASHNADWHVVEMDQCAGDIFDALAASCRYLESFDGGGPI